MGSGPALALLIIAVFSVFIFWGRTSAGRAVLVRVFGGPPSRRKTRRTVTRKASSRAPRKPAAKRGARK